MFRAKPISKAETNTGKRPVINADFTPFQISEASRYHQPSARLICASIVVSAEADVAAAPCLIGCHILRLTGGGGGINLCSTFRAKHLQPFGPARQFRARCCLSHSICPV